MAIRSTVRWALLAGAPLLVTASAAARTSQLVQDDEAGMASVRPVVAHADTTDPWSEWQAPLKYDRQDPWGGAALSANRAYRAPVDPSDPWASEVNAKPLRSDVLAPPAVPARKPVRRDVPTAAAKALEDAVKAAIDAGEYDRAAELLRTLRSKNKE